jgi:replicative DNA helicase
MHPFFAKLHADNEDFLVEVEFLAELLLCTEPASVDRARAACHNRMFIEPRVAAILRHVRNSGDRDPIGIYKALHTNRLFGTEKLSVFLGEAIDLAVSGKGTFLTKRAAHVINQYRARSAQEIGQRLIKEADRDAEIGTLLRECEASLGKLRSETYTSRMSMPELMSEVLAGLESGDTQNKVIEFGIPRLDSMIGGLEKGSNTLVCALTSVGKSSFVQNAALHMGFQGYRVLLFSSEMSAQMVGERLLVIRSHLTHAQQQHYGELSKDERHNLVEGANVIAELPIDIVYCPGWDVEQIADHVHEMHATQPLDVVIVDYLQLLNSVQRHESKEQQLDYMAKHLMELGGKLGIATVVCAQLNDEAEGKAPELRHIRGSRAPGQHAWNVVMLSRSKHQNSNEIGIWVRKNRNGPLGNFKIPYTAERYQFGGDGDVDDRTEF